MELGGQVVRKLGLGILIGYNLAAELCFQYEFKLAFHGTVERENIREIDAFIQ